MSLRVELHKEGQPGYDQVCAGAGDVYQKTLDLRPVHYPLEMLGVWRGDQLISGGGFNAAADHDPLLVERFCAPHETGKAAALSTIGVGGRTSWGEITCFFSRDPKLIPFTLGHVFLWLNGAGWLGTLNIVNKLLRLPLRKNGTVLQDVCPVDGTLLSDVPEPFQRAFVENYLDPRRAPQCSAISVPQAASAYAKRLASHDENVTYGEALSDMLGSVILGRVAVA